MPAFNGHVKGWSRGYAYRSGSRDSGITADIGAKSSYTNGETVRLTSRVEMRHGVPWYIVSVHNISTWGRSLEEARQTVLFEKPWNELYDMLNAARGVEYQLFPVFVEHEPEPVPPEPELPEFSDELTGVEAGDLYGDIIHDTSR